MGMLDSMGFHEAIAYDPNEARADFIKRTEAEGFVISYPEADELQIDIDSEEQYETCMKAIDMFCANMDHALTYDEAPSRSGLPRRHIRIRMPFDMTPWQRIALQASFGSDFQRELLSCIRVLRGDEHPTIFVEKKT